MASAVRVFLRDPLERAARIEARLDAPGEPFAELDWGALRLRLGRIADRGRAIVDRFGRRMRDFSAREISEILRIDVTTDPPAVAAVLDAWRAENVGLITSIAQDLHGDVEALVRDATSRGVRVETLAKTVQSRYGVTERRARLIARDQVGKANAALTEQRQTSAGITRYVWSTSRDERVRDMHAELEGQIFSWDDPPITNPAGDRNHPGEDYQCRCTAVPVLD